MGDCKLPFNETKHAVRTVCIPHRPPGLPAGSRLIIRSGRRDSPADGRLIIRAGSAGSANRRTV